MFSSALFAESAYIVVDDVPWEFFKCKKALLGGQREFNVTEKYRKIMNVVFGKPCIYLCNEDPRDDMNHTEVIYYEGNVDFISIKNKLY